MPDALPHRVRCAVLAVEGDSLLMFREAVLGSVVHHGPPGGGLEAGGESIFECARREFQEETGADVEIDRLAYIEQYLPGSRNELNFYFMALQVIGDPRISPRPATKEGEWITEVRYVHRDEMATLEVWPRFLNERFWDDLAAGFSRPIYVGKTGPAA